MGRPRKNVEVPGQETAGTETTNIVAEGQLLNSTPVNQTVADAPITATEMQTLNADGQRAEQEVIQQRVASLLDDAALAERNTLLGTINEQGAAIIARFETLGYTDLADQQLTDNIEFLQLVKKATTSAPAAPLGYVTNDEGKPQPVTGKPVLTEHGWHVPG
jgi:glycerol kinase